MLDTVGDHAHAWTGAPGTSALARANLLRLAWSRSFLDAASWRHRQASTVTPARETGTSMTKRVPVGSLSSIQLVPPCSLTISCTIGRPRPIPATLVEK